MSKKSVLSVPALVDECGGPKSFGEICGFKKNQAQRGSDIKRRRFVPYAYWPMIVAWARDNRRGWLTYKAILEAHVERELD
jgi:hypothetical protein